MLRLAFAAIVLVLRASASAQSPREPIIDMHLHAISLNHFGSYPPPWALPDLRIASSPEDLRERTFAELRRHNVVKAAISGPLNLVQSWRALDPDRFLAGIIISGDMDANRLRQLQELHKTGQLQILGEFGPQYCGRSPGDPAYDGLFALAEEMDLPIGLHMGIGPPRTEADCCPMFRVAAGDPLLVEEVIVRRPRIRLYIMHAGWPHLDHTVALMQVYTQVYADLSVINWFIPRAEFHSYLKRLVDAGLGNRLMYGSDQMLWPEAITKGIEAINSAPFLTAAQKRDILYNNAARFLRLQLQPP